MSLSRHHLVAGAIVCLFVSLAVVYGIVDPLFEPPDEVLHYPYVKHLADGGGLPVQGRDEDALWEQEGSQPPLYYALAAALTFWINTDDLPIVRRINPHARIGIPLAQDNKNVVVHTTTEEFPWRGTVLAVRFIRFFSVAMAAGTILCTYRLGLDLFPDRPILALTAMALNAFIPTFLMVSSSVNNDNLVTLLSSVTLVLLVGVVRRGASPRLLVLIGLVIGLACLSKLSGLGLIPLAGLALGLRQVLASRGSELSAEAPARALAAAMSAARPKEGPLQAGRGAAGKRLESSDLQDATSTIGRICRWAGDCLLVLAPVALIAGWWYVRNWHLYGEPLGLSAMLDVVGRRSGMPSLSKAVGEFRGFRISFWGLFGAVNVLLRPRWAYWVLDGLSLLAASGLALAAWRSRRSGRWPLFLLLGSWIVVVLGSLLRWTIATKGSQGRLTFPAISPICLFLALGFNRWLPSRYATYGAGALVGLLFALAATAPFTAIAPTYARPPILAAEDVPPSAQPFNATYGGVMRLLAHQVGSREVRPGESIPVTLYWQALAPMDEDFSIYIHVFGWHGQPLGQRDSYPGGGSYPTSMWSVGDVVRDTFLVPIRPDAEGPVAAKVEVGLYRLGTMQNLPVVDARGRTVGQPIISLVKIAVPTTPAKPTQPLNANLDNRVRLVGCDLERDQVGPGDELPITLHWEVTNSLDKDYTVLLHLLDMEDRIAGQGDGPPLEGFYPTSFWGAGETLVDRHLLLVHDDAPPGNYRVAVGLYDRATMQRLPILAADGQPTGDRIIAATSQVMPRSPRPGE